MIENALILANAGVAATAEATIAELLKNRDECPQVLVGPAVRKPGPTGRQLYFVIVSADRAGFFTSSFGIKDDDRDLTTACRRAVITGLLQHKPIVVHDIDDELYQARHAEAIWPREKDRVCPVGIEVERPSAQTADTDADPGRRNSRL